MNANAIREIQDLIVSHACLQPAGAQTKSALSAPSHIPRLDLSGLAGLIEYQPDEFTFTALAGTPLSEVINTLTEHGQYLPFDPPLVEAGATLGGTVACGLSGSGRYRFGGVRDFLLAIQFLDGQARLVRSGARVVKNSAGFDLSKLMVGSLGSLGALVELTFKVFPRPVSTTTLQIDFPSVTEALAALTKLTLLPLDLHALDLLPHDGYAQIYLRIGGSPASFPPRLQRLRDLLGQGINLEAEADEAFWRSAREFHWAPTQSSLVKIPLTPHRLLTLDEFLAAQSAERRYLAGANLAWVAWPAPLEMLDQFLVEKQLSGLVLLGPPGLIRLGVTSDERFARRVKQALDPLGRWVEIDRQTESGRTLEVNAQ